MTDTKRMKREPGNARRRRKAIERRARVADAAAERLAVELRAVSRAVGIEQPR